MNNSSKSIKSQVLDFVQENGPMKRTEIIEFIINTFHPERGGYQPTRDRGYYCNPFYTSIWNVKKRTWTAPYFLRSSKEDRRYLQQYKGKYSVVTAID